MGSYTFFGKFRCRLFIISFFLFLLAQSAFPQSGNSFLQFDGVDDCVQTTQVTQVANTFTMEFWAKPDTTDVVLALGTGMHPLMGVIHPSQGQANWGSNSHAGVGIYVGTNIITVVEHTFNYLFVSVVYETNITRWSHIALVYENRVPRLYLNGQLVATGLAGSIQYVHPSIGSESNQQYPNNGFGNSFAPAQYKGSLDEIRISDNIRYASNFTPQARFTNDANTIGLFHFDEGTGTATADESSLANNGTLLNNPTWVENNAPAVSLDTQYLLPGDTLRVPVTIKGFSDIGSLSLKFQYDPSVITWVGAENWYSAVDGALANAYDGIIAIGWDGINGFSVDSTKLVDLKFVYINDSTQLPFITGQCEITDITEQPIVVTYTNGAAYPDLGTPLTGTLAYRNTAFTPLNNAIVRILKNGTKVDSSAANTSGVFGWTNIVQGNYTLQTVHPAVWGGSNSTDALAIRRYLAGLRPLDTLQILAGDVNNSATLTSADALLIRRRLAHYDNSFARGNWVFETPSLRKYHRTQTQDILGLCVGDVNASYVPALLKQTPTVQFITAGEISLEANAPCEIPVYAQAGQTIAAVTLLFDYDPQAITILGVTSRMNNLMYNTVNGNLIIAWDDLAGITIAEGEPLLTIQMEAADNEQTGSIRFTLNTEESEIAGIDGNVMQGVTISAPSFAPALPTEFALSQNFPNPFNPSTTIQYDIPTNAHVRVEIYNTLGEVVEVLADAVQAPGRYSVEWNAKSFTTGVYFYRMTAESSTKNYTQVKKLMLVK